MTALIPIPLACPPVFNLSGQTALVTGATQGLGWAIAQALAACGARLIISDGDAAACDRMAAGLPDARGTAADLQDPQAIANLAAHAGACDVLVCNAGVQGWAGPLADVTDADWHQVMDINLRAAAQLSACLIPTMVARKKGAVILMSSIAGLRGNKSIGLYALSRAALTQLARNLGGAYGVRVNAVSPGLVRTPLAIGLLSDAAFMQRRCGAWANRTRLQASSPCWHQTPADSSPDKTSSSTVELSSATEVEPYPRAYIRTSFHTGTKTHEIREP